MRRVAKELDTGAASLYVYVENRQDLLNQMFDAVAGEIAWDEDPDPKRWREQLVDLLTRIRHAMERHPGIARVPLANIPTGPNAMRAADVVLGVLRAGGVPDASAAWFVDVVFLFVNAAAFETSIYEREVDDYQAFHDEVHRTFAQVDPAVYPNMAALMPYLTTGDGDERFEFGLRLMINGLLNTKPPQITQGP